MAGGVGGFTCWLVSYPQDVVKTRLQVARAVEFSNHSWLVRDGGMLACGRHIFEKEGISGFWKGFSACSARAVIANSFMFAAYEYAQKNTKVVKE